MDLKVTKCEDFNVYGQVDSTVTNSPCVTIAFAPAGPHLKKLAEATMQSVATSAGLRMG